MKMTGAASVPIATICRTSVALSDVKLTIASIVKGLAVMRPLEVEAYWLDATANRIAALTARLARPALLSVGELLIVRLVGDEPMSVSVVPLGSSMRHQCTGVPIDSTALT